jgi:hypothetical protein
MTRRSCLAVAAIFVSPLILSAAPLDRAAIERATGMTGAWHDDEKVYRLEFPRASFAAFKGGNQFPAIVMGEFQLRAAEVDAAMSAALENGLEVTSLHSATGPAAGESPLVTLHIGGEGTADALAAGVKKVADMIKPSPATQPIASSISPKPLDSILGRAGESSNGVYRLVVGREVSMPCACTAGKQMGVATTATFTGNDANATVTGRFACAYGETQAVLKSLRKSGVTITAVVNHMESEAPRLIFVHYRTTGSAADLAKSIKAALDAQKSKPKSPHDDHAHHNH